MSVCKYLELKWDGSISSKNDPNELLLPMGDWQMVIVGVIFHLAVRSFKAETTSYSYLYQCSFPYKMLSICILKLPSCDLLSK